MPIRTNIFLYRLLAEAYFILNTNFLCNLAIIQSWVVIRRHVKCQVEEGFLFICAATINKRNDGTVTSYLSHSGIVKYMCVCVCVE